MKEQKIGILSLPLLLIFAGVAAYLLGFDYSAVLNEIKIFLTGGYRQIGIDEFNLLIMITFVFGTVTLMILSAIVSGIIVSAIKGNTKPTETSEEFHKILEKETEVNDLFYNAALIEEVFARGIFLGILTMVFTGTTSFYILLLFGNGIWSLLHIYNFEKGDRSAVRVIPHFIVGLLLSYLFLAFGLGFLALIVCTITHYTYNMIFFSVIKLGRFSRKNIASMFVNIVIIIVGYYILIQRGVQLAAITPWITENTIRPLSFGTLDMILVIIVVKYSIELVADICLLDKEVFLTRWEKVSDNALTKLVFCWAIAIFSILLIYFEYYIIKWVVGFVFKFTIQSVIVLLAAIGITKSVKTIGFSSGFRTWLTGVPVNFLLICILITMGKVDFIIVCTAAIFLSGIHDMINLGMKSES